MDFDVALAKLLPKNSLSLRVHGFRVFRVWGLGFLGFGGLGFRVFRVWGLGFRVEATWTPKVCRIMAFWAIFRGIGPLSYILLGGLGKGSWVFGV